MLAQFALEQYVTLKQRRGEIPFRIIFKHKYDQATKPNQAIVLTLIYY